MARLRFGRWVCELDDALLAAARPRCSVAPFLTEAPPRLRLRLVPRLEAAAPRFQPEQPALGGYRVEEDGLVTDAPLALFPAELALRALFQQALLAQGGLALHASGVVFGEAGVVALGPSGAGKSTLARLCVESGRAGLLSDELVALLPDGSVHGSPFRSEPDLPATRAEAVGRALLVLEKGSVEALAPVPPRELVGPVLQQVFEGGPGLGLGAGKLARVAALVESLPGFRLTFRKAPAVAAFLQERVHGLPAASR